MPRLWLRARVYAPHLTILNGPGVGAMVVEVTGHTPRWSRSMRGWAVQERTAGDIIAVAETRPYRVDVHDYRQQALVDLSPAPAGSRANPTAFEPAQLELGLGGAS